MFNYSNFCRDVKKDFLNFLNDSLFNKISSLPDKKLILDLTYGVLRSGSIHLSNIVRSLKEKTKPLNVETRLSNALKSKKLSKYEDILMRYNLNELCISPTKVIIDESDIIKPYGKKFEKLSYIHDGSKEGRPKEKGYNVTGCIGIGYRNSVVPLSLEIYSTLDEGFVSTNSNTINLIDKIYLNCKNPLTIVLDRGYDSSTIINYLFEKDAKFVIRAKNKRKYANFTIDKLFSKMKGLYSNNYVNKENKNIYVKFNAKRFTHNKLYKFFYLVYEKRNDENEYRVYITNKNSVTKEEIEDVIKSYRLRWRIEEFFRFIKEEFGYEKYRVRNIKAMNNLSFIILVATSYLTYIYSCNNRIYNMCIKNYINLKNEKLEEKIERKYGYYGIKLYRIKRGLQEILMHSKDKLSLPRSKPKQERYEQLKLF